MTRAEYIENMFESYHLVSVLSKRNDCETLRLRHKTKKKDLVLRSFPQPIVAYDLLADIQCENLAEVYETLLLDDGQIVLEEFIDAITVAESMELRRFKYKETRRILLAICNALTVLHERGIVHRDVKPENVLVNKDGRIVLVDLNISRKESDAKKDTVIMGTVGYAAPEQLGIAQSDARTDLYAVGVLMNVMLTGQHPSTELATGIAGRVVKKCVSVNPKQRYQSAKDLASAL